MLRTADSVKIITLDERNGGEQALLQQFFTLMEKHAPILVCWNGAAFERPVMHYRSILHGLGSNHYWHNNTHHVDLVSQLAGDAPIDEIASMLSLPNKSMLGSNWDRYLAGDLASIHNDILIDTFNTYLIHLRLQLVSGRLYQERYRSECQKLRDTLKQQDNENIYNYLNRWIEGAV